MNETVTQTATGVSTRSSIDLSLELERQLEAEIPNSPTALRDENRTSLDPDVLAHIVTQLRDSLTNVNQEREDLIQQLTEGHARIAELKDAMSLLTDRCETLESDLAIARQKNQEDSEAIAMLRSKVEESRRGLMRLQSERNAESKRMTLDLTHARSPSSNGQRSSNRSSFAPLTGSGVIAAPSSFRRTSTVNENDPDFAQFVANLPGSPATFPVDNEDGHSHANRRRSMFGAVNRASTSQVEGRASPSQMELKSLKQELVSVKAELEETRHELTESNEAREASESCVTALRAFIGQLGDSAQGMQLPPLPTDSHVENINPAPKPQKSTGWGLKLWKVDTNTSSTTAASFGAQPQQPSTLTRRTSVTSQQTTGSGGDREVASPSTAVPLRSKFGAFFTSVSSLTGGVTQQPVPALHQQEPILNGLDGSDVSSVLETPSEPRPENPMPPEPNIGSTVPDSNKPDSYDEEGEGAHAHTAPSSENGGHDTLKVIPL